jgi:hypothetical protein
MSIDERCTCLSLFAGGYRIKDSRTEARLDIELKERDGASNQNDQQGLEEPKWFAVDGQERRIEAAKLEIKIEAKQHERHSCEEHESSAHSVSADGAEPKRCRIDQGHGDRADQGRGPRGR